jgi:transglutaminase-like putative cysteine protease
MTGTATRFTLRHRTRYAFDRAVYLSPHEVRLRPAPHTRAPISRYAFSVDAPAHTLHWQQDPFNNWVARVTFAERVRELALDVEVAATFVDVNPFDFFVEPAAASWPFAYAPPIARALAPCLAHPDAEGPRFDRWVEAFRATIAPDEGTIAMLVRLNRRLRGDVDYRVREEEGVQSAEATLAAGSGSCRDSAWLLGAIVRRLGIAARFVSGYLVELAAGPDMRDAGSLHAWVEAFVPGAGWVGLDPTSGLLAAGGHIPLACAVEPVMAATVSGSSERATVHFDAAITLERA